jgi:hypothetical protein
MNRSCFTCRFRYRPLNYDQWGNRPWRCSAKGGYRLAWGQDIGCELWEEKVKRGAGANAKNGNERIPGSMERAE